jgi:hypothetical protein
MDCSVELPVSLPGLRAERGTTTSLHTGVQVKHPGDVAQLDVPPTPPDPNRPLPIPKTPPPAPPTPTDEPPPEPIEDPPAESEPKPPYTVEQTG